jgi:hypothetical protein
MQIQGIVQHTLCSPGFTINTGQLGYAVHTLPKLQRLHKGCIVQLWNCRREQTMSYYGSSSSGMFAHSSSPQFYCSEPQLIPTHYSSWLIDHSGGRGGRRVDYGRTYVVRPKGRHLATVVWLHGLGDSGARYQLTAKLTLITSFQNLCMC